MAKFTLDSFSLTRVQRSLYVTENEGVILRDF